MALNLINPKVRDCLLMFFEFKDFVDESINRKFGTKKDWIDYLCKSPMGYNSVYEFVDYLIEVGLLLHNGSEKINNKSYDLYIPRKKGIRGILEREIENIPENKEILNKIWSTRWQ